MTKDEHAGVKVKRTADPDLPEQVRKLIASVPPEALERPTPEDLRNPWVGLLEPAFHGNTYFAIVCLAMLWAVTGEMQTLPHLAEQINSFLPLAWAVGAVFVVSWGGVTYLQLSSQQHVCRQLAEVRSRYVLPTELNDDAQALLYRAQIAANAILRSTVHKRDLVDRQRNELVLPQQEFDIAATLRDYTRLLAQEPERPKSENVTHLVSTRRRALTASRDGIERRISALEGYAAQIAEADARYAELQQIQQLTAGSSDVLDLLARTARDDLAVAEIEGLTGEAAVVADAFTAALESAKLVAVTALPLSTKKSA